MDEGTGLSSEEAKEFHGYFMMGFIVFTVIAIIAHFLVWQWRSWFPPEGGYATLIESTKVAVSSFLPFVA